MVGCISNMQQGDQFIFVDRFNQQHKLTYTGTRREIKGCMYEFFTEEGKDGCCFFDDSEVATMKSVVDIPWPKPLEDIYNEEGIEPPDEDTKRRHWDSNTGGSIPYKPFPIKD